MPAKNNVKQRRLVTPSSFFGECLLNLNKLRAHYSMVNKAYLKNLVRKLKARKLNDLQLEFLRALETRMDTFIYKAGLAKSHAHAGQLVSHKFFNLNGRRVNIRSMHVRPGDVITFNKALIIDASRLPAYIVPATNGLSLEREINPEEITFQVDISFDKVLSALS